MPFRMQLKLMQKGGKHLTSELSTGPGPPMARKSKRVVRDAKFYPPLPWPGRFLSIIQLCPIDRFETLIQDWS